jgi:L-arabinose isomerase
MAINQSKIGLFSVGLKTYWGQFKGLKEKLNAYHEKIASEIRTTGVELIDAGMVDDEDKSQRAAELFARCDVEIIFLFISTYALSSTILPVVKNCNKKVILLNLQPSPAINYAYINSLSDRGDKTGEWLSYCQACSVPEIACVFNRSDISYDIISGHLEDSKTYRKLKDWVAAAEIAHRLRKSRVGIMGHYYEGMLDVYSDLTLLSACFGVHFSLIEMSELKKIHETITASEIESKVEEFNTTFDVSSECSSFEIDRAAQTAVMLDKVVAEKNINALAYYYEGTAGSREENIVTSVIAGNTLLTGKGIPVAGECEVKNVIAMKIMAEFGAGGSFSEFYAMDMKEDIVMLGHDGPAHFNMAEGRVKLVPLPVYHGKPGQGLSIQMSVRKGDVTLLSVAETKQGIALIVAEGESVEGEVLDIGNTNSRYKFPVSATDFIDAWSKAGPSHHCAIGIGHIAEKIARLADLLKISVIKIC